MLLTIYGEGDLTIYGEGDLINVEMCGVCDLHEREEILVGKPEEKRHFEGLGVYMRMILKCILNT
jgi:hypothetical protein